MDELEHLHARIGAALDRIAAAGADLAPAGEVERLSQALKAERASGMSPPRETLLAQMAELESDRERLRAANEDLRQRVAELRAARSEGLADAHLINASLVTEIEALGAARASDRAEIDAIVALIAPALEHEGTEDA